MLKIISWFLISIITYLVDGFVFSKFSNKKIHMNLKYILLVILFSLINCFIANISSLLVKGIVTDLLVYVFIKMIFNESNVKSLLGVFFIYIGFVISELLSVIMLVVILNIDKSFLSDNIYGSLIVNTIIFVNFILIYSSRKLIMFISKILNWSSNRKIFNIVINIFLSILICYIYVYQLSLDKNSFNDYIIDVICLVGIVIFISQYFKEKSGNEYLSTEYNNLIDYSKAYEDGMIEKFKQQHEYKNQLILIKDMIKENKTKATIYIDQLLNGEMFDENDEWLAKLHHLPSGGIKGFVYFKIKKIISNNINVFIYVNDKLKYKRNQDIINSNIEVFSKLLGIYIDNAIEASLESVDKQIIIDFDVKKDGVVFTISNTYNNLQIEDMFMDGYSTKGKNRGYGLSLAKDLINKNTKICEEKEINGKLYVQKIIVKK